MCFLLLSGVMCFFVCCEVLCVSLSHSRCDVFLCLV